MLPDFFSSRGRVGPAKVLTFTAAGFAAGIILGYIFMGTVHAVLQLKAESLYSRGAERGFPTTDEVRGQWTGEKPQQQQSAAQGAVAIAVQEPQKMGPRESVSGIPTKGTTIHTLVTSNGSPYLNFQNRIMYGTYKAVQKMPGGQQLVAFTRILHRTTPDILTQEVPTFRADPLTPACDTWCEFPVSDRPNAVRQFMDAAVKDPSLIKAPWLLMIETDYVWMKPFQAPPAQDPASHGAAFPFGYITPSAPALDGVMRKMYPPEMGPIVDIPGTGPAPVMLRFAEWLEVVPEWERLTAHIEADPESKERLGWVREMYAFSVATALKRVRLEMLPCPQCTLIAQPPADAAPGEAAMLHYTWGTVIKDAFGRKIWEFDKRTYTAEEIQRKTPRVPLPPAWEEGWKLQDDRPVTRQLYDTLAAMISQINRAVETLPELKPLA